MFQISVLEAVETQNVVPEFMERREEREGGRGGGGRKRRRREEGNIWPSNEGNTRGRRGRRVGTKKVKRGRKERGRKGGNIWSSDERNMREVKERK